MEVNLKKMITNVSPIERNREALKTNPDFNTAQFQLKNRIKGSDLNQYFELTHSEIIGIEKTIRLNVGTTPYYLLLSDPYDPKCPIRRMIVPTEDEVFFAPEESPDPLHEERLSVVRGLTRMYDDRVLLFSNQECSVYCRHCMRGRKVSFNNERMSGEDLDLCFDYLRKTPEVTDVVISGGDPLNLSDSRIEYILKNLEQIESVKICRIGTRNPVTLPFRITPNLLDILEKYNTDNLSIFCNTQFNHVKECTNDAKQSILKLLKVGISVGNQCVILKGINDSGEDMLALHRKLLEMRVRAYYMYDPELIPGSRGFRTPLAKGLEIIDYMR
jgi:lysine 2,3-aminomutase